MPEYSQKLKDPRWQKMRLKILERDNFTCQRCKDDRSTLHIHHRYYENGLDPWEYPEDSLETLCEDCHGTETELLKETMPLLIKALRARYTARQLDRLLIGFSYRVNQHKGLAESESSGIAYALLDEELLSHVIHEWGKGSWDG